MLCRPEERPILELAGGSGYEPPLQRPLVEVQADLAQELVTEAGWSPTAVFPMAREGCCPGQLAPPLESQ